MLYHTASTGPSIEAVHLAFAMAIRIAIENELNEIAIFVHGKTNLDGVVSDALGGIARKLQKPNGTIEITGITVHLETERVKSNFQSGVLIAMHLSTKLLEKALQDQRATDVIYVPWAPEELGEYLNENSSTELSVSNK